MKIIIIKENNPFFSSCASANRWRTLIEGLANNGVIINIIVIGGYQSLEEYNTRDSELVYKNINIVHTYFFPNNSLWARRISTYIVQPLFRLINYIKVKNIIKTVSPDIVWIENRLETLLLYSKLHPSICKNIKTMIELSEFDDVYIPTNILQKRTLDRTKKLFRDTLSQIDIFTVMTKTLLQYYQNLSGNRGYYIHLPMTVDFSRFGNTPQSNLKQPYVIYCGTMSNAKDGVDILIKAFAKSTVNFPQLNLYLVGHDYPDTRNQKELILEYGLSDRIIYLGPKQRDEIPALLKGAQVLALARPDSRQAQGGFPTKLGEYLATGNPVCVTITGEIANYLTDNQSAFLAEPGNVDSFANALSRALLDRENAKRVGQNGQKVAEENFNMDKQAGKLYSALNAILNM